MAAVSQLTSKHRGLNVPKDKDEAWYRLLAEATTLRAKVLRDADDIAALRKQVEDLEAELREEREVLLR